MIYFWININLLCINVYTISKLFVTYIQCIVRYCIIKLDLEYTRRISLFTVYPYIVLLFIKFQFISIMCVLDIQYRQKKYFSIFVKT